MAQRLVQVVDTGSVAVGAYKTVAHSLESNGAAVTPTLIFPNAPTTLYVSDATPTTVEFYNPGPAPAGAQFRLERGWQPEVDASTVGNLFWSGFGDGASSRGANRWYSQTNTVTGFASNTSTETFYPNSVTIPAFYLQAGSTVQFRVAGSFLNTTGAGLVTTLAFFGDVDGVTPGTGALAWFSLAGLPSGSFSLTATSTIRASGTNVGTGGGITGCFGSGAGSFSIGETSVAPHPSYPTGLNTTRDVRLCMAATFSAANPNNSFTINEFEIYVSR